MKTIYLRDETFKAICEALGESLAGKEMTIDFLVNRFGLESDQVKAEIAHFEQLTAAEKEFREGISRWRGRGSSITSQ